MSRKGQNMLLAKMQADLKAQHAADIHRIREFDLMVMLLTVNEHLHIGPGRASKLVNAYLAQHMEFCDTFLEDYDSDTETVYSKHKLAARLKRILGPEGWAQYHQLFPFLRDYWED